MGGVFISYRRTDGGGWAGRLNDHLTLRFGSNVVWQDVENLKIGKDYLPQILQKIKSSDAVLIVIGPHWLKDGIKRLHDRKNVLRMEIQQALKSRGELARQLWRRQQLSRAALAEHTNRSTTGGYALSVRNEAWRLQSVQGL